MLIAKWGAVAECDASRHLTATSAAVCTAVRSHKLLLVERQAESAGVVLVLILVEKGDVDDV